MDEVNQAFREFQTWFMTDRDYATWEKARMDLLDTTWESLTQSQLAEQADYVCTKIMTRGSDQAQQALLAQMLPVARSHEHMTINSTAIANMALVTQTQPGHWALFRDRIKKGAIKIRSGY